MLKTKSKHSLVPENWEYERALLEASSDLVQVIEAVVEEVDGEEENSKVKDGRDMLKWWIPSNLLFWITLKLLFLKLMITIKGGLSS